MAQIARRNRDVRCDSNHGKMLSTSDFQSEVGKVFGEIGGELPAKFGRRFSSFFCRGKSSEASSTKTPPQISPSNFTTRFWAVAALKCQKSLCKDPAMLACDARNRHVFEDRAMRSACDSDPLWFGLRCEQPAMPNR